MHTYTSATEFEANVCPSESASKTVTVARVVLTGSTEDTLNEVVFSFSNGRDAIAECLAGLENVHAVMHASEPISGRPLSNGGLRISWDLYVDGTTHIGYAWVDIDVPIEQS